MEPILTVRGMDKSFSATVALLLVLFLIYLNNEFAILSKFRKKQEVQP